MGVIVVAEHVEPGRSATSMDKRPVFQAMLARLKSEHDADDVIVYNLSRLNRNRLDDARVLMTMQSLRVTLVSPKRTSTRRRRGSSCMRARRPSMTTVRTPTAPTAATGWARRPRTAARWAGRPSATSTCVTPPRVMRCAGLAVQAPVDAAGRLLPRSRDLSGRRLPRSARAAHQSGTLRPGTRGARHARGRRRALAPASSLPQGDAVVRLLPGPRHRVAHDPAAHGPDAAASDRPGHG